VTENAMSRQHGIAGPASSHSIFVRSALPAAFAVLAAGCPLPPQGHRTENAGSPPVDREIVSYGFDIQPIFDKNCVVCHRKDGLGESAGIPLHLNSGQARLDLIDQPSVRNPNLILVLPGDPDNSLLYQKVSQDLPPVGFRMPLFDEPLSDVEIDLIRRWIEQGALP